MSANVRNPIEHTPGPWKVEEPEYDGRGNYVYRVTGNTGTKILTGINPITTGNPVIFQIWSRISYGHNGFFNNPEEGTGWENVSTLPHEANAALISAAPDLLEALQECAEVLNLFASRAGVQTEDAALRSDAEDFGALSALRNARNAVNKAEGRKEVYNA